MKKNTLIALLVCVIASAAVWSAWSQSEDAVGVKTSDNFTYHFEVLWSSTDQSLTPPQVFIDMNQTVSIHFNVTDVSATTVFVNITNDMKDGTQTSTPWFVNVLDGRASDTLLFIIQANLNAGDQAFSMADPAAVAVGAAVEPFTITETVTKTYLGSTWTVNHYTERRSNVTTGDYVARNAYYDKATGVLLELTITYYEATYKETTSEHWIINQFNSSVAPDGTDGTTDGNSGALLEWLTPIVIVVVAVIIVILATMVVLRRRKKPQEQKSPPSSPPFPQDLLL
jgi:hypothetical protein